MRREIDPEYRAHITAFMVALAVCVGAGLALAKSQVLSRDLPQSFRQIPFDIISNKPWVMVRVNGSEPQSFILDTGDRLTSVIARECADRLHLPLGDQIEARVGAGQGVKVALTTTPNVTLEIAGDTLNSPELSVFELAHVSPYEGHRLDGLLGEDFMRRHVVELDYAKRRLRIYSAAYRYAGPGTPIPITFHGGLVVAQATMSVPGRGTIPCQVVIDTGVRTRVVWYHPFVIAHELTTAVPRIITGTIGGGAGGETRGDIGRIDSLRIGNLLAIRPTVVFSRDTSGVFSRNEEDGIVGGELLRRCKVSFDYPHSQIVLEPYASPVTEFDYDMSGLFLVAPGPDFGHVIIQSVAPGSPGEEVGLSKGDEIVSIEGHEATHMTLDEVREFLKEDGASRHLKIRRGEDERNVVLKLRRLV